jgi:hypothetical protein
MKIRLGHVTNSSSSSFVLIGEQVTLSDILNDENFDTKDYFMIGVDICEGLDIFRIKAEHLPWLEMASQHPNWNNEEFTFIDTIAARTWDPHKIDLSREDLPAEFSIFAGTGDQHSSDDEHLFRENYQEYLYED